MGVSIREDPDGSLMRDPIWEMGLHETWLP